MSHFPSTWSGGTTSIYRRNLIKGVVALPFAYGLTPLARAADPLIRYDIASAQGQAMLAVYADAVSRMKALGDANPMSWLWQWYEHFVDGTTTKTNETQPNLRHDAFGDADARQRNLEYLPVAHGPGCEPFPALASIVRAVLRTHHPAGQRAHRLHPAVLGLHVQ